jgi:hypothetical protein
VSGEKGMLGELNRRLIDVKEKIRIKQKLLSALKKHKNLLTWCMIILLFSVISCNIDSRLVAQDKKPIFVLPTSTLLDGGTTIYLGLGYRVIGWNHLEVRQIDGKKVNGILKGYEISTAFNPQDISKGPQKELKFINNK